MAKIDIVVGSVMGTALGVARHAAKLLESNGHTITLHEIFRQKSLDNDTNLLICTSSTGMGDLPESIAPFYRFLLTSNPPIANMPYGVISLGDSSYPNFAQAGTTIDEALSDLGAKRCGDILVMDAIYEDDHEQTAAIWLEQWHQQL